MTAISFAALRPEYHRWLLTYKETKQQTVAHRAAQIIGLIPHYKAVSIKTGVPAVWLAATMERESSSNLNTYLGNGDRVIGQAAVNARRRTTDVPRGRGPFLTWDDGAIDALHLDGMDRVAQLSGGWAPEMACYQWEKWNGFGYRNHGKRTPYVVGATSLQQPGRYAGDGNWTLQWDTQLGTLPLAIELIRLDQTLDLTPSLFHFDGVTGDPSNLPPTVPTPADFAPGTMLWVQHVLNAKQSAGLVEDGVYGLQTKRAIQAFQRAHPGLAVDGIAGPETIKALQA